MQRRIKDDKNTEKVFASKLKRVASFLTVRGFLIVSKMDAAKFLSKALIRAMWPTFVWLVPIF